MLINLLTSKYTKAWKGLPGNLDLKTDFQTDKQISGTLFKPTAL